MPEYSSTTITPSDGGQVPGMNGSTSGNLLLSALKSYILAEKGLANGLASLDGNGKLTASQLPDLADDVIVVASYASLPATGTAGKIYITADNNKMYRWDPDLTTPDYVELSVDLSAYATKAELAAEESAREAADSNLKDAIQANTNRISNLEEKADPTGAYKTVNYRGMNDVPTGKAKYALVESIVGKSRAWNQLNGNENPSSSGAVGGITFTNNQNGSWTISGTATGNTAHYISNSIAFQSGHKYLLAGVPSGYDTNICVRVNNDSNSDFGSGVIFEYSSSAQLMIRVKQDTNISSGVTFKPILRDLTLIFPEGVPSTVAECVQKCPDLLKYDAYGTSIVDTTVEGVKSVGVNIWDEVTELGYWNVGTGASESSTTRLRSKNYIPVIPNSVLYFNCNARPILFDETKTFMADISPNIGYQDHVAWTVPAGCFFIKLNLATDYGTTYNHDIQISEVHGSVSTVNTTYHPYMTDTLTLPSPVTLRSAGSVADNDELNVEVLVDGQRVSRRRKTKKVGSYTFTGNEEWEYVDAWTNPAFRLYYTAWDAVAPYAKVGDMAVTMDEYLTVPSQSSWGNISAQGNKVVGCVLTSAGIVIRDDTYNGNLAGFKAHIAGKTMNYELAEESVTLLDPIENNTIATEGGGIIETIQTQTPVIDNCMDVGYLAL